MNLEKRRYRNIMRKNEIFRKFRISLKEKTQPVSTYKIGRFLWRKNISGIIMEFCFLWNFDFLGICVFYVDFFLGFSKVLFFDICLLDNFVQ